MPGRQLKLDSDSRNDQKTKFVIWFVRTPWQTLSNQRINVFWLVFPATCVQDLDLKSQKTRNLTHKKWQSASLWDRMGYNHQQQRGISFFYAGFFQKWNLSILGVCSRPNWSKRSAQEGRFWEDCDVSKSVWGKSFMPRERLKKQYSNLEFER